MSSDTLSDDFDDDVFDHVDVETILQSSQLPSTVKEPARGQQPRREFKADPQLDDGLFDDVDADELLRSSQPTNKPQKRGCGSDALSRGDDGGDNQQPSLGTDHLASSKRQKTDHESTLWQNTEQDNENVKLARKLLADKFGYKNFRHEQEGAIRRILAGENTLVIFPTGAGKSLCYQVSCLPSQYCHFLLTSWFA